MPHQTPVQTRPALKRPALISTLVLVVVAALVIGVRVQAPARAASDASPGARDVIVHLFEWPWNSIATECTNVLGPKGFGAVQVSPPQEHVELAGNGYPWWQDYQPVSYQLTTRRGDRTAFASMVSTCHAAGVKIYVDAVINHMTGGGSAGNGPGSAGNTYTQYSNPAVPYGFDDFHHCGRHGNDDIQTWTDRWEVQNCELVNLADLKTESSYVRGKITGYLNDLVGLGVDGFRVDAAKHIPVADLQAIYGSLNNTASGRPYIYQEVIEGGSGEISPTEYTGIGDVTDFRYGDVVGNAFANGGLANLQNLPSQMLLANGDAQVFIDNHDTQRNGRTKLNYKNGTNYSLAEAFMLAYPFGTVSVMSGFSFASADQGPPATSDGTTTAVNCGSGWVCEHRVRTTANLVGFHNTVNGTAITQWWSNGNNQIAFGRGSAGYVAFNREGSAFTRTFQTALPAGTYCDVANGDVAGNSCSGTAYTVDNAGQFTATVPAGAMLALHINARTSGGGTTCTTVSTTIGVNATTSWGQNVFIVGNTGALGNWDPNSAVALSSASYPVWTGSVQLPLSTTVQYKYIKKNGSQVIWESDPNRSVSTGTACTLTLNDTWR